MKLALTETRSYKVGRFYYYYCSMSQKSKKTLNHEFCGQIVQGNLTN
jgi:hypothetical protein